MEQQIISVERDRTELTLSGLRGRITPEQHELMRRLWSGGDNLGWTTAKYLFHKLPAARSRRALESLGGSIVTEATGGMEESYVLRLLGALVGDRGLEFEDLIARLLAYEVKRYDDDMDVKEITKAEVERDLRITEPALSDLYRLVRMPGASLSNGSSGPPDWKLGVLKNVHDLTEVQDWPRFVREHALDGYDPALPVRAAARDEYVARRRVVYAEDADLPSFWLTDHFRLFISHVAAHKTSARALQVALQRFHISGFVAHEDIEPTKKWEEEILAALQSADALVALLTPDFHESKWTDQEVGHMMGRAKLVISVQLDATQPYGFLARSQALNGRGKSPEKLARSLFTALARNEGTRRRIAEAFVACFDPWHDAGTLDDLEYMDRELAARVRDAFNSDPRLGGAPRFGEQAESALARWKL